MLVALAAATVAPSPARAATEVSVCGSVAVYVPATTLLNGVLLVGATPFVIAAGTSLDSSVAVGADLCFDLTLTLGSITDATVIANTTATVDVCGQVHGYAAATASSEGSLTVGGGSFVVAIGTSLPASVAVGANLCLHLILDGFGQVSSGSAQANVTSTIDVCGQVIALTAATATSDGSITIGGTSHVIAAGATLGAGTSVNAYLSLRLTLGGFGRVTDATVLKVGISAADACGTTGFLIPTPSPLGLPAPTSAPGLGGSLTIPAQSDSPGASGSPAAAMGSPRISRAPPTVNTPESATASAPASIARIDDRTTAANTVVDAGQILPDTASLRRAGLAVLHVSLPLLLLFAGLIARELVLRRRRPATSRHDARVTDAEA